MKTPSLGNGKVYLIGSAIAALLFAGCASSQPASDDNSDTGSTATPDQTQAVTQQPAMAPSDGWTLHMTSKKLFPGNTDMTVNKYCKTVVGDMMECQLYDGNDGDSRLVGMEVMVDSQMFGTFSAAEKKLWMPTKDLMASTMTAMPELDSTQFNNVSQSLAGNYSKIYLLWDPGKLNIPNGSPVVNVMDTTVASGTVATPSTSANPASPGATPAAQPATNGTASPAPVASTNGGFSYGVFDTAKLLAAGLSDKKGNFEDSVLQTNNVGSLELYKLKNNIGLHTYANTTQLIYIVSGTGEFTVGSKKQAVGPGMVVIIPAGMAQAFQNSGTKDNPLVFVTFKTPFDDTDVKWN